MRTSRPPYDDVSVTVTVSPQGNWARGGLEEAAMALACPRKATSQEQPGAHSPAPPQPAKADVGKKSNQRETIAKAIDAGPFFSPLSLLRRGCFDPMQPPKSKSSS